MILFLAAILSSCGREDPSAVSLSSPPYELPPELRAYKNTYENGTCNWPSEEESTDFLAKRGIRLPASAKFRGGVIEVQVNYAELRYQIPSSDIAAAFETFISNPNWTPITLSDTGKATQLDVGASERRGHRCFGLDTGQDWITVSFNADTEIFAYSEDYYD